MALKRDPATGEVLDTATGVVYSNLEQARGAGVSASGGSRNLGSYSSQYSGVPVASERYQLGHPLSDKTADIKTGVPFSQRAGMGVKITPQGKVGYLESKYGKGNVAVRDDGEIFIKNPQSTGIQDKWVQADEKGLSVGDLGGISGGLLEAGPPIATGFLTGNPWAVGAAAAGGNVARQVASEALPGEESLSMLDRAALPVASGLTAGVGQFGFNKLFPAMDVIRPHNIVANSVNKSYNTPFARRAETLQDAIPGLKFSPGQATGSRGQLTLEGMARRHPASADIVTQKLDMPNIEAGQKALNRLLDNISSEGGAVTTGARVESTFKALTNKLVDARRSQGAKDFGVLERLSGNNPIARTSSVRNEVQSIIDDFDVPGGGDATASLVNKLKSLISEDGGIPEQATAKQMQRLLQVYSNAAKGTGQLFKDVDSAQQRYIAGRVLSALQRDLDDAVEAGGTSGAAAQALKQARDNYRVNSQKINELSETTLGRLFNGKYEPSPEKVSNTILKMSPSEVKASMGILESQNPMAADTARRYMLEEAVTSARPSGSQKISEATSILGGKGIKYDTNLISPSKFVTYIDKNSDKFLAAGYKPKDLVQMKRIYESFGRLSDRAKTDGSPTWVLAMSMDVGKGLVSGHPLDMAKAGAVILTPRKIAQAMATDKGRKALVTLKNNIGITGEKSKRVANATAYLSYLWAKSPEASSEDAPEGAQAVQQEMQEQMRQ